MIYCPNSDCAKPRNQANSSFCSHCGTPLKIGDRFLLTEPLEESSQTFLAVDQHLPSKPRCVVINRGDLSTRDGWSQGQFARLEYLGNQGHLPPLMALVDCPIAKGRSAAPSKLLAHHWIGGASLAHRLEQNGAMNELTLRKHLNSLLADLVQIHDQGFIHGDIRPSTLVQRTADQRLLAASYREIAPICEANQQAQGQTQDLQVLQYWAPERKLGQPVPASDLYSLGVSAIQLLTAQPLEQLFDVAEDCWCWEDSLEAEVSDGLKALINCMLERATRRRYSSAVDVLRDLSHLDDLTELADLAEPIAPLQSTPLAVPSLAQTEASTAGVTDLDSPSNNIAANLKDSGEMETFPLGQGASDPGEATASRSPLIGNAIDDAQIQTATDAGLEQIVIYSQFPKDSPSADDPQAETETLPEEEAVAETPLGPSVPAEDLEESTVVSQNALALEALDSLGVSQPPEAPLETLPAQPASGEEVGAMEESANLSPADSLQTTTPIQELEPTSNSRRSHNNTRELVGKVLANPRAISIGSLIQQLTQRYATQGKTYLPWEIMQSLKQLKRTPDNESTFATQLLEMANFYRDQIGQGHRDLRHLTIAIVSYEQALTGLSDRHPAICHDLGQMYLNLSRQHPSYRVACLKKSVATFQRGLLQAEVNDEAYLELQNQLGEAYGTLASCEDPAENWQGAIAAYRAALAVCVQDPTEAMDEAELHRNERHGAIQNNLGTALWNLSLHSPSSETSEHLQGAIAAYNAALAHHDPDIDPVRFGMIQNNLGTAYLNLAQNEKSIDLLRLATGTYQVALMYRKRNEVPLAHAATQNNLGAASLQLASHAYADPQTQRDSLEQSIMAYEAALKLVRELSAVGATSIGFDPSASRLNLALAHQRRGCLSDSAQNSSVIFAHLETAMQMYLNLLEKQPPESEIHEMTLEYLGQTMHYLSENLQIADNHPLLTQVPNHVVAAMSQQFQRQLQQAS